MTPALNTLLREIEEFDARLGTHQVIQQVEPERIREKVEATFDLTRPTPLEELVNSVSNMMWKGNLHNTHPRYFGLFSPATKTASVVADALVALFNPQLAAWSSAPFANEAETLVLLTLARQIGLDTGRLAAHFTTGGAEANLTASTVALSQRVRDFKTHGVFGTSGQPTLYASEEAHGSIEKNAHVNGLGRSAVRRVPCTDGRMEVDALSRIIERDRGSGHVPFMVVATAGTTSGGAIDPLVEIAAICREQELWLHVDAAWGAAAALVPEYRSHFAGIEFADSLSWDAAKWLSVSMGAGMFYCRHPDAVRQTFETEASYMREQSSMCENPFESTMQWSRRFIGLKVLLTIAEMGMPALIEEIARMSELGDELRRQLLSQGWTIVNNTPLPVVCFTHPRIVAGTTTIDEVLQSVYKSGDAWISSVRIGVHRAFRACVTNFKTSADDVERLVSTLNRSIGIEPRKGSRN